MTDVYAPQSPTDSREFVKSFLSDGTANFERVGFEELDFSAVFGKVTYSSTQNAIAYGIKGFTLDEDNGSIKVGYPLQCMSLDDPDCFMQGVVTLKDQTYSPAYIEVAITIISPVVNTTNNWELSVVPLAGFSINPSATVGISTTSIDASGAGPFTFTTQTGKLFMQPNAIGGTVVCAALADPKTYLFGRIKANNSTGLVVEKIYSNATTAVSAWSIQMFDGPDDGLAMDDVVGLSVTNSGFTITVTSGQARDGTDTIDLVLPGAISKDITSTFAVGTGLGSQVASGNLPGTVTVAGNAITGTGTLFLTDLPKPTTDTSLRTIINTGGNSATVATVTNDTSAAATIADVTGATYSRGGWLAGTLIYYWVVLVRRDSDGVCDIITAQSDVNDVPDLPSGFSYYRRLGYLSIGLSGTIEDIDMEIATPSSAQVFLLNESAAFPNGFTLNSSTSVLRNQQSSTSYNFHRAALTGDVTASSNINITTIAANAVTNTKLNDMAAYTLKGRNAGTTGDPSDIDISALTEKVTVADADLFLIQDSAASNAFKKVQKSNIGGAAAFPTDMGLITEAATIAFDAGTVP